MSVIGTVHDAQRAMWGLRIDCPCGCDAPDSRLYMAGAADDDPRLSRRVIGHGESRTVYLVNGVVYKVGRSSTNEGEHEALTAWRQAGGSWAPATDLHEVRDEFGAPTLVLAMPYLPDDGGTIDAATLAQIRSAAPQTCRENYVSHQGRTYLIDGGDIEVYPPLADYKEEKEQ